MIEENQEAQVAPQAPEGEGENTNAETISLSKTEYEKLNQTLGSLKRELKDLRKPKEDADTPKKTNTDDSALAQKGFLRSAGIAQPDEVELALSTSKKWDMPIDQLVDDVDFIAKLEKHRTTRANADATSNIRGDKGGTSVKSTPEYWIAKGTPPTAADIPDRKARTEIARAMMAHASVGKKFYND